MIYTDNKILYNNGLTNCIFVHTIVARKYISNLL